MIIKLTEHIDGEKHYLRNKRTVMAVRMKEDFMLETWIGWAQGRKGDWVVEIADTIRVPVSEAAFLKEYSIVDCETSPCSFCADNPDKDNARAAPHG
jgi:hypothetical protein